MFDVWGFAIIVVIIVTALFIIPSLFGYNVLVKGLRIFRFGADVVFLERRQRRNRESDVDDIAKQSVRILSIEELNASAVRRLFHCLNKMDYEVRTVLMHPETQTSIEAAGILAITLARRILRHADEMFDEVLWPGTQIVTSLKTLDPEDETQLLCFYPRGTMAPERRRQPGTTDPGPSKIPKGGTAAGKVFREGQGFYVPDTEAPGQYSGEAFELIKKWRVGSLVVRPVRLKGHVAAVLKIDSQRKGAIHESELADLLLSAVTTKLEMAFQIACWESPQLASKLFNGEVGESL